MQRLFKMLLWRGEKLQAWMNSKDVIYLKYYQSGRQAETQEKLDWYLNVVLLNFVYVFSLFEKSVH